MKNACMHRSWGGNARRGMIMRAVESARGVESWVMGEDDCL